MVLSSERMMWLVRWGRTECRWLQQWKTNTSCLKLKVKWWERDRKLDHLKFTFLQIYIFQNTRQLLNAMVMENEKIKPLEDEIAKLRANYAFTTVPSLRRIKHVVCWSEKFLRRNGEVGHESERISWPQVFRYLQGKSGSIWCKGMYHETHRATDTWVAKRGYFR